MYVAAPCIPKTILRRVIRKMFLSVFIILTGQGVTHAQNNICMILSLIWILRTLRIGSCVEVFASRLRKSTNTIKNLN